MMSNKESEERKKPLNIKYLLSNDKYIIPIYQRSYAWGKVEISQFIRDIIEFESENYYLGALTCFKRENGSFELIDGQQRYTNISLINAYLKFKKSPEAINSPNLKFDSRKNAQQFLEDLHNTNNFDNISISGIQNFKDGLGYIVEELQETDVEKFVLNFYQKVKIFRVEVPQNTDLNHYFEIMNNRGEQLEKHEIVKANLMSKISVEKDQETFAAIWNACSDMNNYVYFNFTPDSRKSLFNPDVNIRAEIDYFSKILISGNTDNSEITLADILKEDVVAEDLPEERKTQKEKYKSIIDFPNFLLQVLKVKNEEVSLDDKKLLAEFNKLIMEPEAKQFAYNLLKYRTIFDKYIIKQDLSDADENKQNWGIKKLNYELDSKKIEIKYSLVKTFEDGEELIKLQTMLYYSNPSNSNNKWLQTILSEGKFEKKIYEKQLFKIAGSGMDTKKLFYPAVSILNFYFIDFLLWKLYKQDNKNVPLELKSLKIKIDIKKDLFRNFNFKQINSKEHLFPQASVFQLNEDFLNGIGNLCLISTSQNSAGNNRNPSDKKELFKKDNSSLKRVVMFESYENDKWEEKQIQYHKVEIEKLIEISLLSEEDIFY